MNTNTLAACAGIATLALTVGCAPAPRVVTQQPPVVAAVPADAGYVIGMHRNHFTAGAHDHGAAKAAINRALTTPATAADVRRSTTADLNHDGFVTADEVAALWQAGLDDMEIVRRLEATGYVFRLTELEHQRLLASGVPTRVISQMSRLRVS